MGAFPFDPIRADPIERPIKSKVSMMSGHGGGGGERSFRRPVAETHVCFVDDCLQTTDCLYSFIARSALSNTIPEIYLC